jgi:hypothetical protein
MIGVPAIFFAQSLGATFTVLGIISAFTPLMTVMQIPSARFLERASCRRFVPGGWGMRTPFTFSAPTLQTYKPDKPMLTRLNLSTKLRDVIGRLLFFSMIGSAALLRAAAQEIPFASDILPQFSHSEILQEYADTDCDVHIQRSASLVPKTEPVKIDLTVSLTGIDPATLTPDTPFSLTFGNLAIDGKLQDDPRFSAGKTKASIDIETDYGQPLPGEVDFGVGGSIEFDWSDGATLKVTARITNGTDWYFPVAWNMLDELYADADDPHVGPEPIGMDQESFEFIFGNRILEREVYYEGTMSADYFYNKTQDCEEILDRIEITGQISQPTVQIDSPADETESRIPNPRIGGIATNLNFSDISDVVVSVNGGEPESSDVGPPSAQGDRNSWNWSNNLIKLSPGRNVVAAVAIDSEDLESVAATRVINYPIDSRVAVNKVGEGTMTGGFPATVTVKTASTLAIDAIPKPGWVFVGWSGSSTSKGNRLRFEVVPDAVLTATFEAGPFLDRAGLYAGGNFLAQFQDQVASTLKINLTLFGTFTGQFNIGADQFTLRGAFDASGKFTQTFTRRSLPPVTLNLSMDLDDPDHPVDAEIDSGGVQESYAANRLGSDNPDALAGAYTATIARTDDPIYDSPAYPAGNGFAAIKLDDLGRAVIAGRLPDGTRFATSGMIANDDSLFLFIRPHRNEGIFSGNLLFRDIPETSDADGLFYWHRPPGRRFGLTYLDGFAMELSVLASKFTPPAPGTRVFPNNASSATVSADDSTATLFSKTVAIDANNRVIAPADADKLRVDLAPRTGLFNGSFVQDKKNRRFKGAILQKSASGYGCFLDGTETGSIVITTGP